MWLSGMIRTIRFLFDRDVKLSKKFIVLIPVIYFISPVDLIPDYFFPLAGWLDDAAVIVVMVGVIKKMLTDYYSGNLKSQRKDDKNTIDIDEDDYEVK